MGGSLEGHGRHHSGGEEKKVRLRRIDGERRR